MNRILTRWHLLHFILSGRSRCFESDNILGIIRPIWLMVSFLSKMCADVNPAVSCSFSVPPFVSPFLLPSSSKFVREECSSSLISPSLHLSTRHYNTSFFLYSHGQQLIALEISSNIDAELQISTIITHFILIFEGTNRSNGKRGNSDRSFPYGIPNVSDDIEVLA